MLQMCIKIQPMSRYEARCHRIELQLWCMSSHNYQDRARFDSEKNEINLDEWIATMREIIQQPHESYPFK